ncbi:MAG: hypothetical protein NUV80_04450 [Candidatus Berkelbacteria bacterium]|nr:hypothetical protein [Candidatus Berkelbacteria bacterium]
MPNITRDELNQINESAKKKRLDMDAQLEAFGYKRVGDKYLKIPTADETDPELSFDEAQRFNVPVGTRRSAVQGQSVPDKPIVPTEAERTSQRTDATIGEVVNQISELSKKVNKSNNRLIQSFKVITGKYLQTDVDAAELDSKRGYLSQIIRSLGEKGTLSEGDVQRAIATIPSISDTRAVAQRKIASLQKVLKAASEAGKNTPQQDPLGIF